MRPPPPPANAPPPRPRVTLSAAELVDEARAGDRASFSELIRRYRPRIHALALHLTGDQHEADDIAQDTFLRAFSGLADFRAAAEFYTWVYRIALNLALNARRRIARRRSASLDDPRVALAVQVDAGGDPRRAAELRQLYTRLLAALDGLPESLRTTVVLVALQGLSHEQAAGVLACPAGTVAWRIHEARRRLHDAILPPRRQGVSPREEDSGLFRFVPAFGR